MALDINDWEVLAANNNNTPPDGWPENTMQYSDVNNTAREGMSVVARFNKDINGSLDTAGAANAYTLTLNQNTYTAYFRGMYFAARILTTNTGASTINVTSGAVLGAQNIFDREGDAIAANTLIAGTIYEFRYDGTNFQVMSPLTGSIFIDNAVIGDNEAIDLTDVGNALNVGAADPATAQHVAVD